jgi:hypothetical protein
MTTEELKNAIGNLVITGINGACPDYVAVWAELDRRDAETQNAAECTQAMKEGVAIRIADLEARVRELEADLAHLRADAGRDSCADYVTRNRELEALNVTLCERVAAASEVIGRCAERGATPAIRHLEGQR